MTDFFDEFKRKPHLYEPLSTEQKECVYDLRKQKQELLQKNSNLNIEVHNLKCRVAQQDEDERLLRERRNALNAEVADLSKENKQLKADNDTLRRMAQTFAVWYVKAVEEGEALKDNVKQQAEQIMEHIEEKMELRSGKPLAVKIDGAKVSEHLKSELDSLYQEFKELEKSYDALHDDHSELKVEYEKVKTELSEANTSFFNVDGKYREKTDALLQIKGHIVALAGYGYTDEEGHPLHNNMTFVTIADLVDLPSSAITPTPIISPEEAAKMNPEDLVGKAVLDTSAVTDADKITSGTINAFKKAVAESTKDLDKRIVDALKQALDIKTPTEPTPGKPSGGRKLSYGGGENDGTQSDS